MSKIKLSIYISIFFLLTGNVFADTKDDTAIKNKAIFLKKQINHLENKVGSLKKQIKTVHSINPANLSKSTQTQIIDYKTLFEMYAHGPVVVTSPTFGVRRATYDEYEDEPKTLIEQSTINDDLILLHLRHKIEDYAAKNNIEMPKRPVVVLSGSLEGAIRNNYNYSKTQKIDFDLDGAQLDIVGEIGPWVTSAMMITYDNDRPSANTRVSNSKLVLNRAFFSIGRLRSNPFYLTIGQIYAPFGRFASNLISKPATRILGRMKDRMVILGFSKKAFNVQAYAFPGETKGVNNGFGKTVLGHSGFNIGNNYEIGKFKIDVEGSVIGNIAETEGFQKNIFNNSKEGEMIHSRVWGFDGRGRIKYDPFTVSAEYVGAGKSFDERDVKFNGQGAKPGALSLEGAIDFKVKNRPCAFAIGYGETWQALSLNLPKKYYFVQYDIEIFNHTLFGVEFRHNVNYELTDTATVAKPPIGKHENVATAKIFVYF